MFLRCHKRKKDGKEHRYYSVEESRRLQSGKDVQRRVLYLGEINDSQQATWRKTLDVFDQQQQRSTTLNLVAEERAIPADGVHTIEVKLSAMQLRRGAAVWQLLARVRVMAAVGIGSVLGAEVVTGPGRCELGAGIATAGSEPFDRPGQRVSCAPAVVRSKRDGRTA